MKKKIAVFTSSWNGEVSYQVFQGIQRRAKQENADIYIFCCYGGGSRYDDLYEKGEYNIFQLPNLSDFDGAIMISNDVASQAVVYDIQASIQKAGIPAISLEQELDGLYYIGTDNYSAMYEMVRHLVLVHECKTFNYVGGPSGHMENIQRKKGFEDALEDLGISVEKERIKEYSFVQGDGEKAFEEFSRMNMECPDAVVCANDEMAVGYIRAAIRQGFSVPEDFIVTGFDNLDKARDYAPRITSVDREREGMGYRSVALLFQIMNKRNINRRKFLPYRCEYSESCGCLRKNIRFSDDFRQKTFEESYAEKNLWILIDHFRRNLLNDQTNTGFGRVLNEFIPKFGMDQLCICMNHQEDGDGMFSDEDLGRIGYAEKMDVFYSYNKGVNGMEEIIPLSKLLPDNFIDEIESHVYLFAPIHYNGRNFGYCAIMDNFSFVRHFELFHWISTINLAVEEVRQNNVLIKVNEKLNELYIRDSMTGLYNRFGLRQQGEPLYSRNLAEGKSTTILFIDMDGLKMINDTFGHEMGDLAIKAIANCVKMSVKEMEAQIIRYGGDEFLVIMSCGEEREAARIKQDIKDMLVRYNHYSRLPFEVMASIGYVITDLNGEYALQDYIKQADADMYEEKKKHHAGRKEKKTE